MQRQGMVPDEVTYGALMHSCAVSGSLKQAASIFAKVEAQGLQPTVELYTAYIDAHVKASHSAKSLQRAFEVGAAISFTIVTWSEIMCCWPEAICSMLLPLLGGLNEEL